MIDDIDSWLLKIRMQLILKQGEVHMLYVYAFQVKGAEKMNHARICTPKKINFVHCGLCLGPIYLYHDLSASSAL